MPCTTVPVIIPDVRKLRSHTLVLVLVDRDTTQAGVRKVVYVSLVRMYRHVRMDVCMHVFSGVCMVC